MINTITIKRKKYACGNITQMESDVLMFNNFIGDKEFIQSVGDSTITGFVRKLKNESIIGTRITHENYLKLTDEQKAGTFYVVDLIESEPNIATMFYEYITNIGDIMGSLGYTDISKIGSGNITGIISELKSEINNVSETVFYSDPISEDEVDYNFQKSNATIFGNQTWNYYATKQDINNVYKSIDTLNKMFNNINSSKVFNTKDSMIQWLKNKQNKNLLTVGDMLFIKETNVPDYWVTDVRDTVNKDGLYYDIQDIETSKINLTDYDNILGNVDISRLYDATITGTLNYLNNIVIRLDELCK